ncbi:MAG: hypothetical protein IKU24_00270, partial [Clostridia bacterium]|nr:hypothetical protein [Clostridia bacterium]
VGEGSPLPKNEVKISRFGKIVERNLLNIPEQYPNMLIDQYVIMPNHIHLILWVNSSSENEGSAGGETPPLRKSIIDAIGRMKYFATKEINEEKGTQGEKIFQRSFFDHIIRDGEDYKNHLQYIYENPMKWNEDNLFVEKDL